MNHEVKPLQNSSEKLYYLQIEVKAQRRKGARAQRQYTM